MKTMVSLVSDQTIPNVLGILHFRPDCLLFVSTPEMEKKEMVQATLRVLERRRPGIYRLGENAHVVVCREDSILDCHQKLEKWIADQGEGEFVVNLTGGTKLMSIAAYDFFKDYDSRMIYFPITGNFYHVPFPKKAPRAPTAVAERLGVVDYLTAYGLRVINGEKLDRYARQAAGRREMTRFIVENYQGLEPLLTWFGSRLRDKRDARKAVELKEARGPANEIERAFLEKLGARAEEGSLQVSLSPPDIEYLTGGWLEEYCYNVADGLRGRFVDDAVLNIQIQNRNNRDNEFDVMFTCDNTLYFIECKSLEQQHDRKFDALYKIGALRKDFGLRGASFFVTTSRHVVDEATGGIRQAVEERAKQFNIFIVNPKDLPRLGEVLEERLVGKEHAD
ncbi:MAG TPA: DUF1887 family CARF protein [Syntrophales bacterium]|nr:DUF1887 family CARF protein [Syntrophales bacterium]